MSRYIPFKDLKQNKVSLIGKRAAILADLKKANYPIQEGIIIVSKIFKEFLVETAITANLFTAVKNGDFEKAQDLVINAQFPESLSDEIIEAAKQLNTKEFTVSLSSPFDEEFGCYNIQLDKIPEWVQRCWASLFSEENKEQIKNENWYPAVIVQPHIDIQKAGTFYTINPAKMENNRMVVEIVSPRQSYIVLDKRKGIILNDTDFRRVNATFMHELSRLIKFSKEIEQYFKVPQKIDWIFNEKFYITNARKLTEKDKDHFLSQATSSLLKSKMPARPSLTA